jgi:hypothetical protein
MGIRKELHLQRNGAWTTMPLAKYTLTRDPEKKKKKKKKKKREKEKEKLCDWLK